MTSGRSCFCRLGDVLRLHLRVTGVKQPHLVSMLAQHRRQRLDSQGRKGHHLEASGVRSRIYSVPREAIGKSFGP